MVSCNVLSYWAQLINVFLWDGKFSPIVIYRSKFQRTDWTLNSSYGELHCDTFKFVIAWQWLLNKLNSLSTVLSLPLSVQARKWFWFSTQTSSVPGFFLFLVDFTRATLVVLCHGENGKPFCPAEL